MRQKLGVGITVYGSREAAVVDALLRSPNYDVSVFAADKQRNPFVERYAKKHEVVKGFGKPEGIPHMVDFFRTYEDKIDIVLAQCEGPVISGLRNELENRGTKIRYILCPTSEAAIESDKIAQRLLLQACYSQANPRWRYFDPADGSVETQRNNVHRWYEKLTGGAVVKPRGTSFGKGVGVEGDHFNGFDEMWPFFASNFESGPVIIEEREKGEEFSTQYFWDGAHLVSTGEVRDYKRARQGDKGKNTGGIGSYTDRHGSLPFLNIGHNDVWEADFIARQFFEQMRLQYGNRALLGMPMYQGMMATKKGVKLLENNSRPGDPEFINVLARTIDFADVCVRMAEGRLTRIPMNDKAVVLIYKVPPHYTEEGPEPADKTVDLSGAERLVEAYNGRLLVYPGSMELRDGNTYSMGSRTVCAVGIADDTEEARLIAQDGLRVIRGDLIQRPDIATEGHIHASVEHMKKLRTV